MDLPRDILYNRINDRVDLMIKQGLLEEAKFIKSLELSGDSTVMQAIGYKEFYDYYRHMMDKYSAPSINPKDTSDHEKLTDAKLQLKNKTM